MDALSVSDWINVVIAFGVVATAVFTGLTALSAIRQASLHMPVVESSIQPSGDGLYAIRFILHKPDRDRFTLAKASVVAPRRARLIKAGYVRGLTGEPEPSPEGPRRRSVAFTRSDPDSYVFLDPRGASEADISITVALRADPKLSSRTTVRHKIHD